MKYRPEIEELRPSKEDFLRYFSSNLPISSGQSPYVLGVGEQLGRFSFLFVFQDAGEHNREGEPVANTETRPILHRIDPNQTV